MPPILDERGSTGSSQYPFRCRVWRPPVAIGTLAGFRAPHAAVRVNPLYQRNPNFYYWANYLPDSQTVYITYSNCAEGPALKFADFIAGVFGGHR
jgi:hypothetical protein